MVIDRHVLKKFLYLIISLLEMTFVLISPFFIMNLIDKGIMEKSWSDVITYFTILGIILVTLDFTSTIKYYYENKIELQDGINYREKLHKKIRRLKNINDIENSLSIYTTDIDVIREKDATIINLATSIMKLVTVLVIIYFIDIKIVILTLFMMILLPILPFILSRKLPMVSNEILEKKSDFIRYISSSLVASKEIRLASLESKDFHNVVKYLDLTRPSILRFHKLNSLAVLNNLVYTIIFCLAILICINEIFKGNLTIGSLTALMSYLALTSAPIQEITGYYNHLRIIIGSSKRYNNIMNSEEILSISKSSITNNTFDNSLIILNRIKKKNICKVINETIEKDEWVIIKGESGKGKTTLLNIIAQLDNEYSGEVLFKGKLLNEYEPSSIYKNLVYITQNHKLMEDPNNNEKLMNIKDINEFEYHLQRLNVYHLFEENTSFNDMSGGEKQRFLLALALEKQPEILMLDEPTSALDYKNTKILIDHLYSVRSNLTTIISSHDKEFDFIKNKIIL